MYAGEECGDAGTGLMECGNAKTLEMMQKALEGGLEAWEWVLGLWCFKETWRWRLEFGSEISSEGVRE